jgi:hypothetical protein
MLSLVSNAQQPLDFRLLHSIADSNKGNVKSLDGVTYQGSIAIGNFTKRVPDNRAVTRFSAEVREMTRIHDGLVESQNIEGDSPRLEQRDHGLKFTATANQKASWILPLVRDD